MRTFTLCLIRHVLNFDRTSNFSLRLHDISTRDEIRSHDMNTVANNRSKNASPIQEVD